MEAVHLLQDGGVLHLLECVQMEGTLLSSVQLFRKDHLKEI